MSSNSHKRNRRASVEARRQAYLEHDPADPSAEAKLTINRRGEVVERERAKTETREHGESRVPIRRLGFTATNRDREKARFLLKKQLENEGWDQGPNDPKHPVRAKWDEEMAKRLKSLEEGWHPTLLRAYEELVQVSCCPNRRHIRDNVEIRAIRQIPEVRALEENLTHCSYGRPSTRQLARAIFERLALGDCAPEFRAAQKGFEGSDLELDWAYLDTTDPDEIKPHLREETASRRAMKAMLERHDPSLAWKLNAAVMGRIRERHPDVGKYLAVDATPIEAFLEQSGDTSPEIGAFLNRDTGAAFGHHGGRNRRPKSWRGWKFLLLVDLKTGLALAGMLIPANSPEYVHLPDLLEMAFGLMPWLDPEYIVGDSEYDRSTRLAFDLQTRYGITPVFDLRDNLSKDWEWAETEGVPHCSKHGAMKLYTIERKPKQLEPVAYEPDFEKVRNEFAGRLRWECVDCKKAGVNVNKTTWVKRNARIYTFLPRQGDHKAVGMRQALMLRRNHVESFNSQIKKRGIGGKGHFKARWVTKPAHIEWLCSMAAVGPTLRREAHESGLYAAAVAEAEQLGLTKKVLKVPSNSVTVPISSKRSPARAVSKKAA